MTFEDNWGLLSHAPFVLVLVVVIVLTFQVVRKTTTQFTLGRLLLAVTGLSVAFAIFRIMGPVAVLSAVPIAALFFIATRRDIAPILNTILCTGTGALVALFVGRGVDAPFHHHPLPRALLGALIGWCVGLVVSRKFLKKRTASGKVTVDGYRFAIDPDESYLEAHISADGIRWELEIKSKDTDRYDYDEQAPASVPSLTVFFPIEDVADWRDLAGRSVSFGFEEEQHHPILPDNPANAYVGRHLFLNNHEIQFGEVRAAICEIHWTCEGRETEDGEPYQFCVDAAVRFRGARVAFDDEEELARSRLKSDAKSEPKSVWNKQLSDYGPDDVQKLSDDCKRIAQQWQPDIEAALALLTQHFKREDFAEPEKGSFSLWFPINDID